MLEKVKNMKKLWGNRKNDLKGMKSGVYFLEYRAGGKRETKKFVLLR